MTKLPPAVTIFNVLRPAHSLALLLMLFLLMSTSLAWPDSQVDDTLIPPPSSGERENSLASNSDLSSLRQLFDGVLRRNVSDGKVNYPGIASDPVFFDFIKQLEAAPRLATREAELAYWINAYNALAIKGIIDGKSPSSLFGRYFYFKSSKYKVGGQEINLYDLERKILIPFGEPRIHFAIVCASASCPKLQSYAYIPDKLAQQLDHNTRDFINDPSRNRFDSKRKIAYLSKIFNWYEEDFAKHSGSVQRYLARYIDAPELAKELETGSYQIEYLKYDWSLNGAAP